MNRYPYMYKRTFLAMERYPIILYTSIIDRLYDLMDYYWSAVSAGIIDDSYEQMELTKRLPYLVHTFIERLEPYRGDMNQMLLHTGKASCVGKSTFARKLSKTSHAASAIGQTNEESRRILLRLNIFGSFGSLSHEYHILNSSGCTRR